MNPNEPTSPTGAAAPAPDGSQPGATAAAPGADPAAAGATPTVEEQLAEAEAKLASISDAYLRAKAEVENTRRRGEEELAKARRFAVEAFAESLLPVRDSLEAAIAQPDATREQVLEGVHATLRQLHGVLERNRVLPIDPPPGTRFDPHQHEAISVVPAPADPNTVVTVLQKGYLIAERVLRPALVTVAAPK